MHRWHWIWLSLLCVAASAPRISAQTGVDSTSAPVLAALERAAVAKAKDGFHREALDLFRAVQRHSARVTDDARWAHRKVALGSVVLLHMELAQVDDAIAALEAAGRDDSVQFRAADARRIAAGRSIRIARWTSVRAAEKALSRRWALEHGVALLEAGDVRGTDLVLEADVQLTDDFFAAAPRVEALVRSGRVAPEAILERVRARTSWSSEGTLETRELDRRGNGAWLMQRIDGGTDGRVRTWLREAARLMHPSRPIDGLFLEMKSNGARRLFARDIGVPDGRYAFCGSRLYLSVGGGMASFVFLDDTEEDVAIANKEVSSSYQPETRSIHLSDLPSPLNGFYKVVGTGLDMQLAGKTGTLLLCQVGADD